MTPPMSQNKVVISVKDAAPSMFALVIGPYHSMNANVKGYDIYGAAVRLFTSALLRTISNCIRPGSAPRTRCNSYYGSLLAAKRFEEFCEWQFYSCRTEYFHI